MSRKRRKTTTKRSDLNLQLGSEFFSRDNRMGQGDASGEPSFGSAGTFRLLLIPRVREISENKKKPKALRTLRPITKQTRGIAEITSTRSRQSYRNRVRPGMVRPGMVRDGMVSTIAGRADEIADTVDGVGSAARCFVLLVSVLFQAYSKCALTKLCD